MNYFIAFFLFGSQLCSVAVLAGAGTEEKNYHRPRYVDDGMCTALGIGKLATIDQSTITTHNADCQECDVRITHVPARDWPKKSKRPVFRERLAYPRLLETEEDNIHGPEYLVGTIDTTIYPWEPLEPILYVDQVQHTFAYTMGHYPIQNEKQLTMGESTCYTTFWSIPSYFPEGKAYFNLRSLMEIAMERCETARCAITTMGEYAVKYGFYAIDGDGPKAESGESLTIGDKQEMWVFHINADDTHESAVWVAQRVPDDHLAVIANQYIIGEIDLSNPDYYMASSNIFDVATRSGLWSPDSGVPFNFLHIYGTSQGIESHGMNLRRWRAMTLAAPSQVPLFNPLTDYYATFGYGQDFSQPFPFSIKPDNLMTIQDIMSITRDNYENTAFDLTDNPIGGPFGDVIQTGGSSLREDPEHGLTSSELKSAAFPTRAISIWRTTYSSIAYSRDYLPDEIGGVTWIAQYAPHHSSYTPVYVSTPTVPSSLTNVTQYNFDKTKNYWIHLLTGNYVSRWYIWTIGDVKSFQKELEQDIFSQAASIEKKALKDLQAGDDEDAIQLLSEFQEKIANHIVDKWWDFFHFMVAKYRDIVRVDNFHAENFANAISWINYRRSWMEFVGFWGSPGEPPKGKAQPEGINPIAFNTQATPAEYQQVYPQGSSTKFYLHATTSPNEVTPPPPSTGPDNHDDLPATPSTTTTPTSTSVFSSNSSTIGVICFILGFLAKYILDKICNTRDGYTEISGNDISL